MARDSRQSEGFVRVQTPPPTASSRVAAAASTPLARFIENPQDILALALGRSSSPSHASEGAIEEVVSSTSSSLSSSIDIVMALEEHFQGHLAPDAEIRLLPGGESFPLHSQVHVSRSLVVMLS